MKSVREITDEVKQYRTCYQGNHYIARWNREMLVESLKELGKTDGYISRYLKKNRIRQAGL